MAELDEAHFTTEDEPEGDEPLKRGNGSQRKAKVFVMVESEPFEAPKKGKKDARLAICAMVVIENLEADTIKETMNNVCKKESTEVIMDDSTAHVKTSEAVEKAEARVVKPKEGHARYFLGYTLPYPMQKSYTPICTMESSRSSCNSILMNFVIGSIEDISVNDCSKD